MTLKGLARVKRAFWCSRAHHKSVIALGIDDIVFVVDAVAPTLKGGYSTYVLLAPSGEIVIKALDEDKLLNLIEMMSC